MNKFLIDCFSQLKKKFPNPGLELRILLNKSSKNNKEVILSNLDNLNIDLTKFNNYFQRRIKNEPISKIFNSKNFWKYDFFVTSDVLDPRPETELIIEKIIELFPLKEKKLRILDMCTGSGCIAISLAKEYLNSKIFATDISLKAIEIAKFNAKELKCENRVNFINCDLINRINKFDIVVCNPPYLSNLEYSKTSIEIQKYEPKIALVGSKEGYEFYYRLSKILPRVLDVNSKAFIEIGALQAKKTIDIFKFDNINLISLVKDIQNLDRLLILNKT